jgi:hypothetical protein
VVPAGTVNLTVTGVAKSVPAGLNWKTGVSAVTGACIEDAAIVMVVSAKRASAGISIEGPPGSDTVPPPGPMAAATCGTQTSVMKASTFASTSTASPVVKQWVVWGAFGIFSALVNAAANLVLHFVRQATIFGPSSGSVLAVARAMQLSLQAPLSPAALSFSAVHVLWVFVPA